jgi:hypothetical protein
LKQFRDTTSYKLKKVDRNTFESISVELLIENLAVKEDEAETDDEENVFSDGDITDLDEDYESSDNDEIDID